MAHPPLENGKKTRGRQRVEMRLVEDKAARQVTFSKRKKGLWEMVARLAVVCAANVAIVVFSAAGKVFAFGSPSVDAVLGCGDDGDGPDWGGLEALRREREEKRAEVKKEVERMRALAEKVVELQEQTGKSFWFEVDQAALEVAELPAFMRALQRIRDNVGLYAENKLQSTPAAPRQAAVEPALLLMS